MLAVANSVLTVRGQRNKNGKFLPSCIVFLVTLVVVLRYFRGPAKGYTEALEARLVETEDVLFRALSFISPDEFSRAFGGRWVLSEDVVEGVRSSVVDRKEAVERWSRWPLRSEGDVERWFDERKREGEESGVGDGVERVGRMMVGVGLREMVGGQNKDLRRDSATRLGSITSSRDNEVDSMDYGTGTEISQVRQSQSRQNHLSQAEHLEQSYVSRPQHITPLPLVDIVYDEGIRGQIQETDRSTTANGLGLSRKFQDDFLW